MAPRLGAILRLPGKGKPGDRAATHRHWSVRVPRSFLSWLILIAALYVVAWICGYALYLNDRAPVAVRVEASEFKAPARLTLDGGGSEPARWLMRLAQARAVLVAGAAPIARVRLPIASSNCKALAEQLAAACAGHALHRVRTPLVIDRSADQDVSVDPVRARRIVVTLPAGAPRPGEPAQQAAVHTEGSLGPVVCVDASSSGPLSLMSGGLSAQRRVADEPIACQNGLELDVRSAASPESARTDLLFEHLRGASFKTSARAAELTGAADGTVQITDTRTRISLSPDQVLRFDGTSGLSVDALIPGTVTIRSTSVTSARVDGEEIVPTNFDRHRSLIVTAFFGGIGLLWGIVQLANFLHQRTRAEA